MKIAFFSPLNPMKTGVADYCEELLPYLSKHAQIDLFIDDYLPTNQALMNQFVINKASSFTDGLYDLNLYHMGNSSYHEYIYHMLLRYPGVVVLHENILHHLLLERTLAKGLKEEYLEEMRYCHGEEGLLEAKRWLNREKELDLFSFPCNRRVIENSKGVMVHSNYLKNLLKGQYPSLKVKKISPIFVPPPGTLSKEEARALLGMSSEELAFGCFGFLNPHKRVDVLIRAFAKITQDFPMARLYLVGQENPSFPLRELIERLNLAERVVITGYVDMATFNNYISAMDVCISLRFPSAGETSASLIKCLGAGKPIITSYYLQYAEFPDHCCAKVDVAEYEEEMLVEYLRLLSQRPDLREQMGQNAKEYAKENFNPEAVAREYVSFLKEVIEDASQGSPSFYGKLKAMSSHAKAEISFSDDFDEEISLSLPLAWNWDARYLWALNWAQDFAVAAHCLEGKIDDLVLDFACGSCWSTEWLKRLGYRTVSFELSSRLLSVGKKRFKCDKRLSEVPFPSFFVSGDAEKFLPFKDNTFDVILCLNAFHHMPDYLHVLKEFYRVLKKGGRIVFSEPGSEHSTGGMSLKCIQEQGVLEKNVVLSDIHKKSQKAGFSHFWVKPIPYPQALDFSYVKWKRLVKGDSWVVREYLNSISSLEKSHLIFILQKGSRGMPDSRFPGVLKAEIVILKAPSQVRSGQRFSVSVKVKNLGDTLWLSKPLPYGGYVHLGALLLDSGGRRINLGLGYMLLSKDIQPGEETELTLNLEAPMEKGEYYLKIDMVDSAIAWFEGKGSKPGLIKLLVRED